MIPTVVLLVDAPLIMPKQCIFYIVYEEEEKEIAVQACANMNRNRQMRTTIVFLLV
jgi:hypothetical protein